MPDTMRGGLARRIYLAFLAAAVLPTAVAGVIGVWVSLDRLRSATVFGLQQEVNARASGLRFLFDTVAGELRFFATNPQAVAFLSHQPTPQSPGRPDLEAILGEQYYRMARSQTEVYQIRLLDREGRERVRVDRRPDGVFITPAAKLQDKSDRYYFREAITRPAGALYVSPLDLNVEHGVVEQPERPVIRLATVVTDKAGTTLGMVIVNLHAKVLIETVQQMVQEREGVAYLFDRSSHFLARSGAEGGGAFLMQPLSELRELGQDVLRRLLSDSAGHFVDKGMIWAHAPVEFPAGALGPGAPRWVMAISFPERVLLGQVLELSRLYLLLFVALALAAVAGYRLSRRLIGPLEALTSEVDAIAAGDLGRRVRVEGTDEIARLGERFNAMASQLQATLVQLQGQRDRLEIEVGERTRDLAAERARLAAVLRNASDAIAAVRSDGALLFANRAAERLLAPPREGSAQPMDAALAQLVGDGQPGRTEVTLGQRRLSVSRDRLGGVEAPDERADVRADVVIVARDVTEERRLQDEKRDFDRQVAQMDKLATLGELAMGLAHEIGNPLAGMKAVVQSLLLDDGVTGEARDDLCRLESEIDRLTAFLGSFRGMAAPRLPVMTPQRLAVAIDDMLFWIRQPARVQGVEVSSSVEAGLPPLKADAAQLRQVLLNLLVNALHAMPDGGRLEVRGRAAGSMARIEVHDTGHGVPQNLQASIFKPFFSTRVNGSGLGLAVCAKLVDDHGGSIALASEPGSTTFTIHWPLIDSAKVPR
jgi:nitrogen-specific signal transduction histidine kinase/HAMP domain-containing protein